MGGEFDKSSEWNENQALAWNLLQYKPHKGMQELIKQLNYLYKSEPALYEKSFSPEGFEWLENNDRDKSVFAFIRKGHYQENAIVVVFNLTPVVRQDYRIGVPAAGKWTIVLNSDAKEFHGSEIEVEDVQSEAKPWMNKKQSIALTLPPLGGIVLKLDDVSQIKLKKELQEKEEAKNKIEKTL